MAFLAGCASMSLEERVEAVCANTDATIVEATAKAKAEGRQLSDKEWEKLNRPCKNVLAREKRWQQRRAWGAYRCPNGTIKVPVRSGIGFQTGITCVDKRRF